MNTYKNVKCKGFTLVELLIVITIIAILSAFGLINYLEVLKQGRDTKRQSDLKTIQSALEQYHADNHFYPDDITFGSPLTSNIGRSLPSATPTPKIYLRTVPSDPQQPPNYCYKALPDSPVVCDNEPDRKCVSYELFAKLEVPPPSPSPTFSCGSVISYNLKVTPP